MIVLKGKYNVAKVMIDEIDTTTRDQINTFLNHPSFANSNIAIMPDCHKGVGSVIGFTMRTNNLRSVIPNIIGVDIGCAILTFETSIDASEINLARLDEQIKANIPSGFHINETKNAFDLKNDVNLRCYLEQIAVTIGADYQKVVNAIGTLGGGNHFIEVGTNTKGNAVISIHSGSRNFGKRIADYYQGKAREISDLYKSSEITKDLEVLPSFIQDGQDYLEAVLIAQRYASLNRRAMMEKIARILDIPSLATYILLNEGKLIESVHNYIAKRDDEYIIRKGAISAEDGQKLVIPFNMRDGIAIGIGKGNKDYNYSAPHGAGRILSRTEAKKKLTVETFQKQMRDADIFTTTADKSTLDESPDAYKDMNIILDNIKDTVVIIDLVKPIYNFKAGGD